LRIVSQGLEDELKAPDLRQEEARDNSRADFILQHPESDFPVLLLMHNVRQLTA